MIRQYKSWVPNVTNQLSFSAIGDTKHPSQSVHQNKSTKDKRFIIVYQERDTLDMMLPFRTRWAKLFGIDGQMWFGCLAQAVAEGDDNQAYLEGHLFIWHNKKLWRTNALKTFTTLYSELRSRDDLTDDDIRYLRTEFNKASDNLPATSSFTAKFKLQRNGEIIITHDDSETLGGTAPNLGQDTPKKEAKILEICSQLFFFVKDISHEHQHHNPTTDTIIDLHKDDNDNEWCSQVLFALYRKIIRFKRNKTPDAIVKSLGTLAYATSFKKICKKKQINIPDHCDDSLTASMEAAKDGILLNQGVAHRKSDNLRAWLIGGAGLIFTYASLLKLSDPEIKAVPSPILTSLAELLLENPIIFVSGLGAIIAFLRCRTNKWQIFRAWPKLFQAWKRKFNALSIALLGLLTLSVTVFIAWLLHNPEHIEKILGMMYNPFS
ncbi:hypothetical protein RYZ26_01150 [Terasakiella sp. A23]|uniref:hypothetical protein n=1 Tax=Terasakiella sp. FCG-A23 TaxID=3080561 RepID=UPI0029531CAD|nr:hypothetical protein [Terasakiella sp. A23]MDV7338182.1 hypothetical protein [Terasakiella sp. A23]